MQQRLLSTICILMLLFWIPVIDAVVPVGELPLEWGSSENLVIVSPANQSIGFSANLTNLDNASIELYPSITGEVDWGIEDSLISIAQTTIPAGGSFTIDAGELIDIEVEVNVPPVVDGHPLGETAFPFSLIVRDAAGLSTSWNYSISLIPVHSMVIDSVTEVSTIDPAGTIRHAVTLRNTGNVYAGYEISINPLGDQGQVLATQEPRRFANEGWNVTVHNWAAAGALSPNESVTFEVAVNSPYISAAELSARLTIASQQGGLVEQLTLTTAIELVRAHNVLLDRGDCAVIDEDAACIFEVSVTNDGNFDELPDRIECSTSADWIVLYLQNATAESSFEDIPPNALTPTQTYLREFSVGVSDVVDSGTIALIECAYSGTEVWDSSTVEVTMAEILHWEVVANGSEIRDRRLHFWLEVQNRGNRAEALEASISVSHDTDHGLELPENASWDENSSRVRSYSVSAVPRDGIIRVSAWMDLPAAAVESDDIWIEITLSSPSDSMVESWRTDSSVPGMGHEPEGSDEGQRGLSPGWLAAINSFNQFGFTTIAGIFAMLLLIWAVRRRLASQQRPVEAERRFDDWMGRFFKRSKSLPELESPQVSRSEFKQIFSEKGGGKQIEHVRSMDTRLVNVASGVIDRADLVRTEGQMNAMVDDLLDDLDEDEPLDI